MVEAEEEYTEQMEILVSCFLRPFKMAASSKKPPCSHEDVNSIFLNSETVLFLHQIFLKGLTSRMESWPTLVLGDLFDMLLPMLSIYQEYVRNHHYSLQVLTECKQSSPFVALLNRLENKTACHGRSLETFLTYPMHQEKAAWVSDISQCMDNVHFNDLLHGSLSDTSSVTMPHSIRNDPKLFKDDVDIRFSRTLNSCKIPQIRSATPERLLQRLTDLRFLSIDFLNTFLLTYRVFTDGVTVLEALKKVFYEAEPPDAQITTGSLVSLDVLGTNANEIQLYSEDRRKCFSPRRTSGASSVSDVTAISAPSSPSNLSSVTLVGSTESGSGSGSGSDPSPQEGGIYSRRVSEIDTPGTAEEDAKGTIKFHKSINPYVKKKFAVRKKNSSIREFLGQAWMKTDKATRAPHILLMTKRFNEVSQLVVSEIIRRSNMSARVAAIEKWAAVADINRVLHNYNGVLQICAAFTNSSVYRLKKTWDKVSKTTKQTIERLQHIVSSDGRFRNLRDALHRCDPPCIPYLGLYLTDLSFIEEGTPNVTEGLLNFSKMRMVSFFNFI
ncbi:Ras-specific guanine nucleotide-releasing factor 1 [Acromyrmex echinatior]|uniref:Ras-specific guanine nucleotide-releasing factor 1 n=1 Tax=Acromyrmex echinatior TaxID=103372 RepID=F4WN41_ACREC|nr:Ras-specific guanine nucleotide-releasing factor 1 [Acromyrmex echinatior]